MTLVTVSVSNTHNNHCDGCALSADCVTVAPVTPVVPSSDAPTAPVADRASVAPSVSCEKVGHQLPLSRRRKRRRKRRPRKRRRRNWLYVEGTRKRRRGRGCIRSIKVQVRVSRRAHQWLTKGAKKRVNQREGSVMAKTKRTLYKNQNGRNRIVSTCMFLCPGFVSCLICALVVSFDCVGSVFPCVGYLACCLLLCVCCLLEWYCLVRLVVHGARSVSLLYWFSVRLVLGVFRSCCSLRRVISRSTSRSGVGVRSSNDAPLETDEFLVVSGGVRPPLYARCYRTKFVVDIASGLHPCCGRVILPGRNLCLCEENDVLGPLSIVQLLLAFIYNKIK